MPKSKLVVLSGAGISAESGLSTFRDSGGLWEGYDINEVATFDGWLNDSQKVLDFYNLRRKQAANATPNQAHYGLVELEHHFDVQIITQNVDDLHERAGSSKVLHLHGQLSKARSVTNDHHIIDIGSSDIHLGDLGEDGGQLRPHVVWFGEMVPMLEHAIPHIESAEVLIVVGTSLVVYPAASLVDYAKKDIRKWIVDPQVPDMYSYNDWEHIKEPATVGIKKLVNHFKKEL